MPWWCFWGVDTWALPGGALSSARERLTYLYKYSYSTAIQSKVGGANGGGHATAPAAAAPSFQHVVVPKGDEVCSTPIERVWQPLRSPSHGFMLWLARSSSARWTLNNRSRYRSRSDRRASQSSCTGAAAEMEEGTPPSGTPPPIEEYETVDAPAAATEEAGGQDSLPDELWAEVFARLDMRGEGAEDFATRREWVQTWCRSAQVCRKFAGLFAELRPMEQLSHANWPRLSRQLQQQSSSAAGGSAAGAISQMASLSVVDPPAATVDWADLVDVQMRQSARLYAAHVGPAPDVGPALTRLSREHTLGALPDGHSEWVTCTKFFSGALPRTAAAAAAAGREELEAGGSFSSACRRGALGGQTGLVSCSYDGTVRFWDLSRHGTYREPGPDGEPASGGIQCCATFIPEHGLGHATHLFSCLAFDEAAGVIAAGDIHDNTIKRWVLNDTGRAARSLASTRCNPHCN